MTKNNEPFYCPATAKPLFEEAVYQVSPWGYSRKLSDGFTERPVQIFQQIVILPCQVLILKIIKIINVSMHWGPPGSCQGCSSRASFCQLLIERCIHLQMDRKYLSLGRKDCVMVVTECFNPVSIGDSVPYSTIFIKKTGHKRRNGEVALHFTFHFIVQISLVLILQP